MASFDVEMIGDSPEDVVNRLEDIDLEARNRTKQALMETAREVKQELEQTSPVDTGAYMHSWYVYPVSSEEVWILNSVDHAKFVMLPNANMVGSPNADLPGQGILHNVKGVARKHDGQLRENMVEKLSDLLSQFAQRGR